jgi:hypothetical protein
MGSKRRGYSRSNKLYEESSSAGVIVFVIAVVVVAVALVFLLIWSNLD